MIKENTVLTIDVGGASLKMAEFSIAENGSSIMLERYAVKDFPDELTEADFAGAFANAFHELMHEHQFVSHQVRLSVTSLYSFQRLSKLPPLMGNRTRATQVVESEAKQSVPYPLNEVVWDYQLIKHTKFFEVKGEEETEEGGEKAMDSVEELEALFVAIKDELLTAICTTLLDAEMEILSVEVTPTALYNAAKANGFGDKGCDMVLDMGGRGSNLIIIDGSRIFMRAIPIGGNTITQQIAKEFNITFSDAEEMKRKHCFVALGGAYEDSDSEVASTISKIARNVMTRLHGEINRSINAWRSMYDGNRPTALFISGGSSIIPYVPHFLNEKLRLDVSFLNTFPVVGISSAINRDELLTIAHLFPPLIGLGIRQIRTCPVEISLVPKVLRSHRELQQKKPYFYMSAVCAVLCLLVFYGGVRARTNYDRKLEKLAAGQLKAANEVAKKVKSLAGDLDSKKGDYDGLKGIAESRTAWMELLNELQKITPNNMWFTEIDGLKTYVGDASQGGDMDMMMGMGGMPGMPGGMPGMPGMPGASAMPGGMGGMAPGATPTGGMAPGATPTGGMAPGASSAPATDMAPGAGGAPTGAMPGAMPGGMPGMPGGMPGMPGMGGMMDPMMMGMGMMEPANEVSWLRLKGHSLVLDLESAESVEDHFRKALENSDFFDHEQNSYKIPVLTVNSGNNNITNFVIYVKLKNPIKQ